MNIDYRRLAKGSFLFASLPDPVADKLLAHAFVRSYAQGTTIFLQGQPADAIFVVLDGWVKLFRTTPAGAEAVVGVFTRGRSFGEAAALRGQNLPVTAEAVTECQLLRIDAGVVVQLLKTRPELALSVLSATFVHLQSLVGQVEALKSRTAPQRLAEFLVGLTPEGSTSCTVTLPYDKSLIAGRLGMTPESLSRAFARLRKLGLTVRQNQADIADVARLIGFAHDEEKV